MFFAWSWSPQHYSSVIMIMSIRVIVEFFEKIVFLYFVKEYGSNMLVKSFVNANGDLIIVGIEGDKTIFSFSIKNFGLST